MSKRYVDQPYAWRTVIRAVKSRENKRTVEEGLVLSLKELFDKGLVEHGAFRTGSWRWVDSNIFQVDGTIRYEADLRNHEKASLLLQYELDGVEIDHCVSLAFEQQGPLGRHWWFRCPVNDNRVTKLYLPPGAMRFASRQAHELIYRSSNRGSRRRRSSEWLAVIETRKVGTS